MKFAVRRHKLATSLAEALSIVVSPRVVQACIRDGLRRYLFEAVARRSDRDSTQLLEETSAVLGMAATHELSLPGEDLVRAVGYGFETLAGSRMMPQPARGGYSVAVADPAALDRAGFEELGIQICLADARKIDKVWEDYGLIAPCNEAERRMFDEYRAYSQAARTFAVKAAAPDSVVRASR